MSKPFKPDMVVIDYETELLAGGGSIEFYRSDFRVVSAAFSYYQADGSIKSGVLWGEDQTKKFLQKLADEKIPIWAHNLQFEMGVTICRFPDVEPELRWAGDTMRLVQVFDAGGKEYDTAEVPLTVEQELDAMMAELGAEDTDETKDDKEKEDAPKKINTRGLGLAAAVARILPAKYHNHKAEAHEWILKHVKCKKNEVGSHLGKLPQDILERYNIGDTENTLRLYTFITDYFRDLKYDWTLDHSLFIGILRHVVKAQIRGIKVNRDQALEYEQEIKKEIWEIEHAFLTKFKKEISLVEKSRKEKALAKLKTVVGRENRKRLWELDELTHDYQNRDVKKNKFTRDVAFNIGSNKQLEMLFVEILKIPCKFYTDKGAPSFKSSFLSQWGEGGEMLMKRRKRLIVLKQDQALAELSERDGRWHLALKVASTKTGRLSGGSH